MTTLKQLGDRRPRPRIPHIKDVLLREIEEKKKQPNSPATPEQETNQEQPTTQVQGINLEDYLLLPGKTHGTYSYTDLLVGMYRLQMTPEVEKIGKQLNYSLSNTGTELNKRGYIGNINHTQALTLNLSLGGFTLNLRQFADFLLLLKSGNAQDGNKKRVSRDKLAEILNEITEVRTPWRAEWLDADFKYLDPNKTPVDSNNPNGKLWIYSDHRLVNGVLQPIYKSLLENCLLTKGQEVDLSKMNNQGMPTITGSDFYYYSPDKDNNSVARFVVYSGNAYLGCGRNPAGTYPSLGVRLAFSVK